MILSLIAAVAENNVIGKNNQLLWNLPIDMKHFRDTTSGHPVIMGRKTFESIGRPLPNRRNIVITRDVNYNHEGIEVVHSLEEAIDIFKYDVHDEMFVIGGAEIYKQSIEHADRLYVTYVNAKFDGDAFFPTIDMVFWKEISREHHEKDIKNILSCDFVLYERPIAK